MQSNQITRCPDCGTAFQATKAQLEAAHGSVRCGACLHVFDAQEYLVMAGSDLMFPEPSGQPDQEAQLDPDAQQLNDPAHGPEILSVVAEFAHPVVDQQAAEEPGIPASKPRARVQLPDSIAHEVLELEARKGAAWPRLLAWTMLNLLLVVTLIAQLGYLFFDAWRIHAWTGPWIEKGCEHFECPAPKRNDLDLLETNDLRVRSHPELPGVLILELELSNRAPYSQPLPTLEIEFVDVLGSTIESRRIPPAIYLPAFDAKSDFLHAGTAEQILLETPDPGESAVNYMLRLHPATGN